MTFADRTDAGRQLAARLAEIHLADPVVLGLPRGGVVVAAEVAKGIGAPLDVIIVRKLGVPYEPELAFGAIGEGGAKVLDQDILRRVSIDPAAMTAVEDREGAELSRRAELLRAGRPAVGLEGRTAVVVDDGVATGSTARAACQVARARGAATVVLAAPVAPAGAAERLSDVADLVCFLVTPDNLYAIGQWYTDFAPTPETVVIDLLSGAAP